MASVERLADRVLLHARSTIGWHAAPRTEVPTPAPQQIAVQQSGVDRLISRVLAHASRSRGSEAAPITQEAAELGNTGGQSASLLSSPFLSSLDISGVAGGDASAVSPIAFRPELNSSQETIAERLALKDVKTQSEGHIAGMECLRDARPTDGADNEASTLSFLQSDESKEQEETRLPEEVKPTEPSLGRPQATAPSAAQSDARQLQEMQVTLIELKKQLAEESHEKESLNGALAEALAALAESQRATESAQQQLREVHTRGGTRMEITEETEQEVDTSLQVSQSEISLGAGQGLPSVSGLGTEAQQDFRQHAGIQVDFADPELLEDLAGGSPSQLQALESRLEETQRQLEACLQAAAAPLEDRSNAGIGHVPSFSTEEVSLNPLDDKLMACLDLRYSLGDLLDPPELLLKAAMGQLYAVLCLQTKAKSFLATKQLIGLRRARPCGRNRPSSAMYQASRPPAHRQSLPQAFPHGLQVCTFHELDDEASTERRRWSDAPKAVPLLPLGDLQFNRGRPYTAGSEALDPEVGVVACGSGISAVRACSAVKGKGQCRPSSSPGLFTQKRSDPPVKPLRRAMSAGGAAASRTRATSACRSRPQSHSRKGRCGNPEGFVPQAELWLIKNRALASMMWPPLSEAARGRRPKTKTACVRCLPDPTPQAQGF